VLVSRPFHLPVALYLRHMRESMRSASSAGTNSDASRTRIYKRREVSAAVLALVEYRTLLTASQFGGETRSVKIGGRPCGTLNARGAHSLCSACSALEGHRVD